MRCGKVLGLGLVLLSSLLQPVVAQADLPKCAAQCFQSAVEDQTICQPTDVECICKNAPLSAAIQECVMGACTVKEGLIAANATNTMCEGPVRDRTNVLFITSIISGSIALFAVIVRASMAVTGGSFGLDDIFCLAAEAACLPVTLMQTKASRIGFGKDTWLVSADNIYMIQKLAYASQVSYFPSSGFTKLCFLFFFLRIFPAKRVQQVIYIFIGISVAYIVACGLTITFACKPISATWTVWDGEHKPDYCINQNKFYLISSTFNIALDLAIVAIPLPELLKLKLSLRKKLFLISMFSVGIITIVVSCIRLSAVAIFATSTNPVYDNMMSGVYSVLELNVGIICICMPAFRRLLAHLIPKCFNSTQNEYYKDDTPNARLPSERRSGRKKSTLSGSLFDATIVKTIDTKVEARSREDDEVQLVELQKNGKKFAGSTAGSTEGQFSMPPSQVFYHGD